jgi:tripartite-type tricarboxylate transporter receptor subunit TctC
VAAARDLRRVNSAEPRHRWRDRASVRASIGSFHAPTVSRRGFLKLSIAAAGIAALPCNAGWAQSYPAKPVRVIVPYAAGGGADTLCRTVFGKLSEDFGQQFIVDNRGGAGGTIGAAAVAKSPADGYTILYDATAYSVNPSLLANLPYDPRKDFQPVFLVGVLPLLLLVHPSVNAKTVAEVIAIAKSTPEGINWASAGNGSLQHLALELFRSMADVKLNHGPYKGGAPALTDLTGGHIKFYFSNTAASSSRRAQSEPLLIRVATAWTRFPIFRAFRTRCGGLRRTSGTAFLLEPARRKR